MLKTVCVFCGSSRGIDSAYRVAAAQLGAVLGQSGRRLVYGGGNVGLMGVLAESAMAAGAEVVGVIPQQLVDLEVAHTGVTHLRVVASMHERKQVMADLAEGFVLLPGGLGSLEEFFEIWTWGQLGLHQKPYGLLNVAGYFDSLLQFLDHAVQQRFVRQEHRSLLIEGADPQTLLEQLDRARVATLPKWIDRQST